MSDLSNSPPAGVPPRKWERLVAFLGALPPAAASRLFAVFEAEGESGGLPAGDILKILRTRINSENADFPPRPKTARRLFFQPFEDFFVAGRRGRKRRARIDRATLGPLWTIIVNDAALVAAAKAAGDLDGAIARGETNLERYETQLWTKAAEGLAILVNHADDDEAFRADLARRLQPAKADRTIDRSGAALHDLAEFAMLLPAAAHFRAAQEAFPRPVTALTEEDLFTARRVYARAAREAPAAAPYLLLAIAARMDRPERALRLAFHLSRASDGDLAHAATDAAALEDNVFDELESLARALEADADDDPDTDEAPARLLHFADFAGGVVAEATAERNGAAAARAEASRDIAAAALSRYAETALGAIRRNHPFRHAGGSSKLMSLRPDIARPIDPSAEAEARRAARFLKRAREFAEKLARPEAAGAFVDDAMSETRRYLSDLVAEIRAAEGAERAQTRRRMDAALGVAALLLPEHETALIAERANAAAVSA